jgi:chromosome segregation ATPase
MLDLLLSREDPVTVSSLRQQLMEAHQAQKQAEARASEARLSADEFERKATEAAQRSRNLEERLDDLRTRLQRAESELADATRDTQSLRTEIQSRTAEHSREIRELSLRIGANADLRLSEFRERLASGLRDLLSKIPPPGANVDGELGAILLLRLHEVMDRLEAGEIRVRSKGSAV